jgi:hypothetical protein
MSSQISVLYRFLRATSLVFHEQSLMYPFAFRPKSFDRFTTTLMLSLSSIIFASSSEARVATEFMHSVDQGVVKVSIPIEVPKGNANLTPALSLEYASINGQGALGQGWSIGGLGEIKICAMTPFTDNVLQGVNADDPLGRKAFCLNGTRLIQVGQFGSVAGSRDPNAQEVQFRTEVESFQKIVAFVRPGAGDQNWGGIVGWRVWDKNGLVTEYGFPDAVTFSAVNANNSRIDAFGRALTWLKSRVLDTSGNALEYKYIGGVTETHRISEIKYGANVKTSALMADAHTFINFDWGVAPLLQGVSGSQMTAAGRRFGFNGNPYVANSHYLTSIRTGTKAFNSANSTAPIVAVKHYRFDYQDDSTFGAERGETSRMLKAIRECEPGGTVCFDLASVDFNYQVGFSGFNTNSKALNVPLPTAPAESWNEAPAVYVDLDNDGIADFCSVTVVGIANIYGDLHSKLRCSLGTKTEAPSVSGSFSGFTDPTFDQSISPEMLGFGTGIGKSTTYLGFGDVSGDGVPDACFSAYEVQPFQGAKRRPLGIRCLTGNGNGSFAIGSSFNPLRSLDGEVSNFPYLAVADRGFWLPPLDMNFDGILDFCLYRRNNVDPDAIVCYVSEVTNPTNALSGRSKVSVNLPARLIPVQGETSFRGLSMFVDLNRDGLVDICIPNTTTKTTQCLLLKDEGGGVQARYTFGIAKPLIVNAPQSLNVLVTNAFAGDSELAAQWVDVNGDSIVDLCTHVSSNPPLSAVRVNNNDWRNKLMCFLGDGSGQYVYEPSRFGSWDLPPMSMHGRSFIDVNEDGKTDFCAIKTNGVAFNSAASGRGVVCYPMVSTLTSGAFLQPSPVPLELVNLSSQLSTNHNGVFTTIPITVASNTNVLRTVGTTFVKLGGTPYVHFCRYRDASNVICSQIGSSSRQLDTARSLDGAKEVKFVYDYLPRSDAYSTVGNQVGSIYTANPSRVKKQVSVGAFKAPLIANTPVISVAKMVTENIAGQGIKSEEYSYKNYAFDLFNGRGAVGLESISVKRLTKVADNLGPQAYTTTVTNYNLQWPTTGLPDSVQTIAPNNAVIKDLRISYGAPISSTQDPKYVVVAPTANSACAQISRPVGNFSWPAVVSRYLVSETNWSPVLSQTSGGRDFVSKILTSEYDLDGCGNASLVKTEQYSENDVDLGFSKTKQTTFDNIFDVSNGSTARWFIGQPRTVTTVHRTPDRELSPPSNIAAMPAANTTLYPTPPSPPVPFNQLLWLPAVLNLLLN